MKSIKVKIAAFRISDLKRIIGIEVSKDDVFPAYDNDQSDAAQVCIKGNMVKVRRHWLLLVKEKGAEVMLSMNPKLSEEGSFRIE